MAWAGNRFEPAKEVGSPPRETIEIWKLERIDPLRIIVSFSFCFFLHPSFLPCPLPPFSLFLPQFRWIFIATVTIDLVEEFLLHLIWTLTGNDSIVWHERSLIAIALPCYADLIRPFFSPDANEDGLGTNRAIYLADASHLNFLDYYLIS